jgi:hypothetical protein
MRENATFRPKFLARLEALRTRLRVHLALDGISSVSLALVSICLVSFGLDRVFRLPLSQRVFAFGLLALSVSTLVWRRLVARLRVELPLPELARAVEKLAPSLEWRLVSAVQFLEGADPRGSKELAGLVVSEAEEHAAKIDFTETLDTQAVARRALRGGFVLFCGFLLIWGFPKQTLTWFQRNILLSSTVEWPKDTELHVTVRSGTTFTPLGGEGQKTRIAIPRGADLAVLVSASREIPFRTSLAFEFTGSHIRGSRPLAKRDNNDFRHVFEKIGEDMTFTVTGGDDSVGPLTVSVVRPPWIDELRITAEPPRYTKLPTRTFGIEAGEISLPAGTAITIEAHCTKKLTEGWLEARFAGARLDAPPVRYDAAVASGAGGVAATQSLSASFVLDKTAAVTIDVKDEDELALERPVSLTLRAIPDAPPKVQLLVQGIGQLVTPEAVLPLEIKGTDDYGLFAGSLHFRSTAPNQKAKDGVLDIADLGGLKRETNLSLNWDIGALGLTAGTFLNFSVQVRDDDPHGQKSTDSSSFALRVVNPEELLMDLIRRQHELRRDLERVRDDEDKLASGLENLDTKVQERAGKTQRAILKTVTDAARAMTLVVDEMRNNRLLDERARNRLTEDVIGPLEGLRDGELVKARELADATLASKDEAVKVEKSKEASNSARVVRDELDQIIARMKRVADLAELVAKLRGIIKITHDIQDDIKKSGGK